MRSFIEKSFSNSGQSLVLVAVPYDIDEEMPLSLRSTDSRDPAETSTNQVSRSRENMPITYTVPHGPHREPRPTNSPLQWPQTESAAIQQWRGMTTSLPRRDGQPRPERRGNQPRITNTLHSDTGSCSSEDSVSWGEKPRDVTAYAKYSVRGFLKQYRAKFSVKDTEGEIIPNKDSFVPSPKITFLIDSPTNHICQICQEAPLQMAISAEDPDPGMTAILPCGHVSCYGCINFWLQTHKSCPFCRTSMVHPDCRHQVQPRLIAQDTIHTLPETLANHGTIGGMCFKCTEKHMRHRSIQRLTNLAERFTIARHEAAYLGTKEAIEDMRRAQDAFERLPEDDFLALAKIRHHQW